MQRLLLFLALAVLASEARAYDHSHDPRPVRIGSKAPAFGPLRVLNSKEAGVSRLTFDGSPRRQQKVWLIGFFATWCPGCVNELPVLKALQQEYGARGLQVITVAVDRGTEAAGTLGSFLETNQVRHPVVHDADSRIVRAYEGPSLSLPYLYLVGPDGTVRLTSEGFEGQTEQQLRTALDRLLKTGAEKHPAEVMREN